MLYRLTYSDTILKDEAINFMSTIFPDTFAFFIASQKPSAAWA